MTRRTDLAKAFIEQARSDYAVYLLLESSKGVSSCHKLHYLQMFCEKLAKAYRLRDTGADLDALITRHTGFAKFIVPYVSIALRDDYAGRSQALASVIQDFRRLAGAIEKLAPAVDRETMPENAEYPWERDGRVFTPCTYAFPVTSLLYAAGGRNFLKVLSRAASDFEL